MRSYSDAFLMSSIPAAFPGVVIACEEDGLCDISLKSIPTTYVPLVPDGIG